MRCEPRTSVGLLLACTVVVAPFLWANQDARPLKSAALAGRIEAATFEPIVIEADVEVPEGWSAMFDWDLERPAKGRETNSGRTLYVWAPPGTYEIELEVFLAKYNDATKAIEFKKETSVTQLTVTGSVPPPDPKPPDPTPGPTIGRLSTVLILRDNLADTTTEAATLQRIRQSETFQGGTPKLLILSKAGETPEGKPDPLVAKYLSLVPDGGDLPFYFGLDADDKVLTKGEVPDDSAAFEKTIEGLLK